MNRRVLVVWSIRVAVVLVVVVGWAALGASGPGMERVFPGATALAAGARTALTSDSLIGDLVASARGIGLGFALGAVGGLVGGAVIAVSDRATRLLEPMLYWASSVPKIVLLPVLLLFLGSGTGLKAGHAMLSSLFPIMIGTITALRTLPPIYGRVARSFGLTGLRAGLLVWAPAASGQVLTALRIGLSNAIVSALLVETAVGSEGLGYRAIRYYANLQISEMYVLIGVVFVGATLLNVALERLIRARTKHFGDARTVAV